MAARPADNPPLEADRGGGIVHCRSSVARAPPRLIEAGADVQYVRVSDEMTALKFTVHSCPGEVIQALIDHGAEVDGPRGTNQTALMVAARSNNVVALKVLVKNGTDLSPCGRGGWFGGWGLHVERSEAVANAKRENETEQTEPIGRLMRGKLLSGRELWREFGRAI